MYMIPFLALGFVVNSMIFVISTHQEKPYEILKSDTAWCGPRVLFFYARLYGRNVSLEDVVRICRTDQSGFTSLEQLREAAHELNLAPTPLDTNFEAILSLNLPAILCVSRKQLSSGKSESQILNEKIHFLGFIQCSGDDIWVFDPSVNTSAFRTTRKELESIYLGRALVLDSKGEIDGWITTTNFLRIIGVIAFIIIGYMLYPRIASWIVKRNAS